MKYIKSDSGNITLIIQEQYQISPSFPAYNRIVAELDKEEPDVDKIESLLNVKEALEDAHVDTTDGFIIVDGKDVTERFKADLARGVEPGLAALKYAFEDIEL